MLDKAQDDDLVMSLAELALARPAEEREVYVSSEARIIAEQICPGDGRSSPQ